MKKMRTKRPIGGSFFASLEQIGKLMESGRRGENCNVVLKDGSMNPIFCRQSVVIKQFTYDLARCSVVGQIEGRPFTGSSFPRGQDKGPEYVWEYRFIFLDVRRIQKTFIGKVVLEDDGSWQPLKAL